MASAVVLERVVKSFGKLEVLRASIWTSPSTRWCA